MNLVPRRPHCPYFDRDLHLIYIIVSIEVTCFITCIGTECRMQIPHLLGLEVEMQTMTKWALIRAH